MCPFLNTKWACERSGARRTVLGNSAGPGRRFRIPLTLRLSPMEPLLSRAGAPSTRRDFFKRAGTGVGVVAAASALQACDSTDDPPATGVTLDFSTDVGVLNYAYALEQLEAAFYAEVIRDTARFTAAFPDATEQAILRDIAAHEALHDDFFRTTLTSVAPNGIIPRLTVDFTSITFTSRTNVLAVAQTFEDLGVSAYNGAGQYIQNDAYLLVAGKIVSVEARHASIIAGLITPNTVAGTPGQLDVNALENDKTPQEVLAAADRYIVETITVSGTASN